ncbi:plasmid maintenance protein (plasmid) [Borreliella turdi]|uniref:plasmid maintenance protein n=1 Tax=Borreliella turdi TaxID=57863 RepID=UPI003AF01869
MLKLLNNKQNVPCHNKLQHKLIVLVSTLDYINKKDQKYTQSNIFYYFNANLKRNGQTTIKLKTLQNYLYKLGKELNITNNYHRHLGVNCGTEIYYKLKYSKKECHIKINQYFKEKKHFRFKCRLNNYLKNNGAKERNVNLGECINNKNNIKEEEKSNSQIKKHQIKKYFNKCRFLSKNLFPILNLNISKDNLIEILKIFKKAELDIAKNKNLHIKKFYLIEKQRKLKEILKNVQKQLEKSGCNVKQLETSIKEIYENYKFKPHFIIENQKYKDLSKIQHKLEKQTKIKEENSQKDYKQIKTNIFNILIDWLRKKEKIEVLKPIVKTYLNGEKKLEYNKVFNNTYYYELLEIIRNKKSFYFIESK